MTDYKKSADELGRILDAAIERHRREQQSPSEQNDHDPFSDHYSMIRRLEDRTESLEYRVAAAEDQLKEMRKFNTIAALVLGALIAVALFK